MNARQKRINDIADMAKQNFKDHIITTRLHQGPFRNWHCRTIGREAYSFMVTTIPGRIYVNGDVGDIVLEREYDMLRWARSSIDSIDYFFEKALGKVEEYDPAMAKEWVKEALVEAASNDRTPEQIVELEEIYEGDDYMDEYAFKHRLINEDLCDPAEPPTCENFTYSALWCREAIKWLLAHLPPEAHDVYLYKRNVVQAVRWCERCEYQWPTGEVLPWVRDGVENNSLLRYGNDIFVGEPNAPLNERMVAHPGDWIIRSANGTLGCVPDNVFKEDYESAPYAQEVLCTNASLIALGK